MDEISFYSIEAVTGLFRNTNFNETFNFGLLIENSHKSHLINFLNCPHINTINKEIIEGLPSLKNIRNNHKSIQDERDYLLIGVNYKLMWGILNGKFHWNNVYEGSLAKYDRYPEFKHRKDIFDALNFMRPIKKL